MRKIRRRLIGYLILLTLLTLVCGCGRGDSSGLPFQDDFSDPGSGWGADQRDRFARGYVEGQYFIDLRVPAWFSWANPGLRFGDVSVEADVYLASGSPDNHAGLFCRYAGPADFYYFAISADGYYAIFKRVDSGSLEVLSANGKGMAPSPAVRTGGQTNRVRAVCQGDELSLYVNDTFVETVSDDTHAQGDVGIGAGSGPVGDVVVHFDNLVVAKP